MSATFIQYCPIDEAVCLALYVYGYCSSCPSPGSRPVIDWKRRTKIYAPPHMDISSFPLKIQLQHFGAAGLAPCDFLSNPEGVFEILFRQVTKA